MLLPLRPGNSPRIALRVGLGRTHRLLPPGVRFFSRTVAFTRMAVELEGVSKHFGQFAALRDISFQVDEGEFLTLLGPTGCGKSTLLRIIAGFVRPSSGQVRIDGVVVNDVPPYQRHVGLLFQSYALFPHMTVENNVAFGLRMQRMDRKEMDGKVDAVLALLGIEKLRKRYPAQLSGGQQQRTALARTLVIEPRILLLDEPMAALDRKLKLEMQSELKKLVMRLGITTVCVSHDQDEALTMSDRIAILNGGALEQLGAPLELYDRPRSGFTAGFLGRSNLFSGTIVPDAAGASFFHSGDVRVPLPDAGACEPGTPATLLVRPENLQLVSQPSTGTLSGSVSFVTQLGHSVQYEITLDAGPLIFVTTMRSNGSTPVGLGERVFVAPVSPSAYRVVPGEI